MKTILRILSILTAIFLINNSIQAQVYGTPFAEERFENGIPAGWENGSSSGISQWEYRGPNTVPDVNVGSIGSCVNSSHVVQSETRENGFVIFDSNFWDDPNGPCGQGFNSGQDPAPHTAWLTTASLDFSDQPIVVMNFQQRFRYHIVSQAVVQLSINGGDFFTVYSNPTSTGAQSDPVQYVNVSITQWAAFQSDVRVRFFYQGIYYYWQIDDLVFYAPNDNDLLLETAQYTDFDFSTGLTGLERMEYDRYARIMVPTINFKAKVKNIGALTQTGCTVTGTIVNNLNQQVYSSTSSVFNLNPGQSTTVDWGAYVPPGGVPGNRTYTVTYTVNQNQSDQNLSNNVLVKDFQTTDLRYAMAERNMNSTYVPAAQYLNNPFEIGCVYECTNESRRIASVGVVLSNMTQPGSQIYGIIYNLNRDTIFGITPIQTVNPYYLNAPGQEKIMYLHFETPVPLVNGQFYNVMIGGVGNGEVLRVATHGSPPPFSCFLRYPGTPFTFYLTQTPMVYAHIVNATNVQGCNDPIAANFNPAVTQNDGSCQYPGCTFPNASNFNPAATFDDGSCNLGGCTNPAAPNYNPFATIDDGSCLVAGCANPNASNFNPLATFDDGSCVFTGCTNPLADNYNPAATLDDGSCVISGCTDSAASNYNPSANAENGSCLYPGCTNPAADNYDSGANLDDGSCVISGCTDQVADNFNPAANNNDGSCIFSGCTDPGAANFNPIANLDNGSCLYPGCTNPVADNFDPGANIDDGSCIISGCTNPVADNFDPQANNDDGSCIISGCTDPLAANFNPLANNENGTCIYPGCTDSEALNFDPGANFNDLSCLYPWAEVVTDIQSGCAPLTVLVVNQTAVGNDATCHFDLGDGTEVLDCGPNFQHTYTEPGEYYITYTYTISDSVTDSVFGPISVFALPSNPQLAFNPANHQLNCTNCDNLTLQWFFSDEETNETEASFIAQETGVYGLIATNQFGCQSEYVELFVEVQSAAGLSLSVTEGCLPLTVVISPTNELNPLADCSYWINDVVEVPGCEWFVFEFEVPGEYFITYTYQVGEWISEAVAGPIVVHPLPDEPVISFNPANHELSCGNCSGVTFEWWLNDVPLAVSDTAFIVAESGVYVLIFTNSSGCQTMAEWVVEVQSEAEFSVSEISGCAPLVINVFNLTDLNPDGTCSFNLGDGESAEICENFVHTYTEPGSYFIQYTYQVGEWVSTAEIGPIDVYEVPVNPVLSFDPETNLVSCENCEEAVLFHWAFNGAPSMVNVSSMVATQTGTFTLSVENEFGCESGVTSIFVDVIGVEESNAVQWSVYPNPANDLVSIVTSAGGYSLRVFDSMGRLVNARDAIHSRVWMLDVSGWSSGIYTLQFQSDGSNKTFRLVVNR
jgi:hypothetical protein